MVGLLEKFELRIQIFAIKTVTLNIISYNIIMHCNIHLLANVRKKTFY